MFSKDSIRKALLETLRTIGIALGIILLALASGLWGVGY